MTKIHLQPKPKTILSKIKDLYAENATIGSLFSNEESDMGSYTIIPEEPLPISSARTLIKIQGKLTELERKYPGILQLELFDFLDILEAGAKKYAQNNWLEPDGNKCSNKDMTASMFRHLAEAFATEDMDKESGLDPLLHLQCRAGMLHTRRARGIKHDDDK